MKGWSWNYNRCPFCNKRNCYTHCSQASDGKHVPDPRSSVCDINWVVDFNCLNCGLSGSVPIDLKDILWD